MFLFRISSHVPVHDARTGDIIAKCLDLNMMNRRWIADADCGDRLSRFIVVFAYACKALLRGISLAEKEEDGEGLVQRGLLTQAELDHMHAHPCWQPHYCIDMIRAIIVEAHKIPGGRGITFDEGHKLHAHVFRCFDDIVKHLSDVIGDCVRTRSSGLPASYDAITMTIFFVFFILAAFVWSISMQWMTPVITGCASFVTMLIVVMGSKLVSRADGLDRANARGLFCQLHNHRCPIRHEYLRTVSQMLFS